MAVTYTRGRIRLAVDVTRQDPIQDAVTDPERRRQLARYLADFQAFGAKLAA